MKIFVYSLAIIAFLASPIIQAQKYKSMMDDHNINFYEVVKEAEKYFETHEKGKSS